MSRGRVHLKIEGIEKWFETLDAHKGPQEETVAALDATLKGGFEQTQAAVHIITGSLKMSGRETSSTEGSSWRGEISYGGPAPGAVHDPVRYAKYEFGRGGDHDAMANLHLIYRDLEEALFQTVRDRGAAR